MPGSPYFDEVPKGILTWPKLLTYSTPPLILTLFLAFILFTTNPFERVDELPLDGRGLNPLLQDPGLALHPPMLYIGYVGLSVSFSFSVAALITCLLYTSPSPRD